MEQVSPARLKVFALERVETLPVIPLLQEFFPPATTKNNALFQDVSSEQHRGIVELVATVKEADYVMVPHNWAFLEKHPLYIEKVRDYMKKEGQGKYVIVFYIGDSDRAIPLQRALVFRTSLYRSTMARNEICMPAFAQDLALLTASDKNITIKEAIKTIPSVGFVGRAAFRNCFDYCKSFIKSIAKPQERRDGRFFRQEALAVLGYSNKIQLNALARPYYSGHLKTIEKDPQVARIEFINNIINNDCTLAPKGDGNYSLRFYEVLSLGRLPVIIDTDMVLPLEDRINYKEFVIFCSMKEVKVIDKVIAAFFSKLSPEGYCNAQKKAREAFEQFLFAPRFFRHTMNASFLERYKYNE